MTLLAKRRAMSIISRMPATNTTPVAPASTAPSSQPAQPAEARSRALMGVAAVAGWYLIALVGIGLGIAVTAAEVASDPEHPRAVEFLPAAIAALLLLTLRPYGHEFSAPGPRLTESDNRELFALLHEVSTAVGVDSFDQVYLAPDARVSVVERDRTRGFGVTRALVIGIAFLRVATEQQLRAAVTHELTRVHSGGSRLDSFVGRTRKRMQQGLGELAAAGRTPLTSVPFAANAHFFLRSTAALDRSLELAADDAATRVAGGAAVAAILELQPGLPAAADAWTTEWAAGRRVPFDEFVRRDDVARKIRFAAFRRREDTASGGSEVPLQDRIARALTQAAAEGERPDRPARTLLPGFVAYEQRLIGDLAARRSPA